MLNDIFLVNRVIFIFNSFFITFVSFDKSSYFSQFFRQYSRKVLLFTSESIKVNTYIQLLYLLHIDIVLFTLLYQIQIWMNATVRDWMIAIQKQIVRTQKALTTVTVDRVTTVRASCVLVSYAHPKSLLLLPWAGIFTAVFISFFKYIFVFFYVKLNSWKHKFWANWRSHVNVIYWLIFEIFIPYVTFNKMNIHVYPQV